MSGRPTSWEAIKLSKSSFAHEQAPNREVTLGMYSSMVSRGADADLHVAQSGSTCRTNMFMCSVPLLAQ